MLWGLALSRGRVNDLNQNDSEGGIMKNRWIGGFLIIMVVALLVVVGFASLQELNEQNEQAAQLTKIEHRLDQIQNRMDAIAFGKGD